MMGSGVSNLYVFFKRATGVALRIKICRFKRGINPLKPKVWIKRKSFNHLHPSVLCGVAQDNLQREAMLGIKHDLNPPQGLNFNKASKTACPTSVYLNSPFSVKNGKK
jgi:hypothetical protein